MKKIEELLGYKAADTSEIPDIDLYMDQLTLLLDRILGNLTRDEEEKTLTKTMINNYVKGKVIEPPVKKKYNKEQIMKLIMTYQMKNILQISDLKTVFDAMEETGDGLDCYYKHYGEIQESTINDIEESISLSKDRATGNHDKKELLEQIMKLTIEADMRKRIAEKLIDELV